MPTTTEYDALLAIIREARALLSEEVPTRSLARIGGLLASADRELTIMLAKEAIMGFPVAIRQNPFEPWKDQPRETA